MLDPTYANGQTRTVTEWGSNVYINAFPFELSLSLDTPTR